MPREPSEGVRILGAIQPEYAELLRQADAIFIEELRRAGLYDRTAQAFVVLLPVRTVGVMGDGRRYDYVIALRAVETVDFMTARWARLPYDFLDHVSRRIINEIPGISRVTLAMARRRELPSWFAHVDEHRSLPLRARWQGAPQAWPRTSTRRSAAAAIRLRCWTRCSPADGSSESTGMRRRSPMLSGGK